ncbi:MAG: peptidoglycan hydrolase CwlO-like protein [Candidatus Paceibacteria bacterium]|jgi:peptidoglycan hydrolase CwlO-like protein
MNSIVKRTIVFFLPAIGIVVLFLISITVLFAATVDETEKILREQLLKTEKEIQQTTGVLNVQKAKSAVIQGEVNKLTTQIRSAQSNINSKSRAISELGEDIVLKDQTVKELNSKMESGKESLAQLIKKTNQLDGVSLAEIILGEGDISEFFVTVDSYSTVQNSLEILFDDIRELRGLTEEEKISLQGKRDKEADIKAEIERDKKAVEVKEDEKSSLLAISKNTEKTFEQILAEKQARANSIRTALFQLRDSAGISFGDALAYAKQASKATGVRTAFILAILKQESDLGKNVGTCNRPGDPANKKWNVIMPGPNDNSWRDDQTIFLGITKRLGLDPNSTPLSCPYGSGWGGAMGPSQFIPATWQSYESRIGQAAGVSIPSPWNPAHAFIATSLYVKDLGAAAGGYTAERTAALKYYAGGNWNLAQNAFYGNSVLNHATAFQEQIDFLNDLD